MEGLWVKFPFVFGTSSIVVLTSSLWTSPSATFVYTLICYNYSMVININYLLECLETEKLSELVACLDLPLLDINILLWDAEQSGAVEIDRENDKIVSNEKGVPFYNQQLARNMLKAVRYYADVHKTNLTIGRLATWVCNPGIDHNYLQHEYIATLQYLINTKQVLEQKVVVPKDGGREEKIFNFLCLPENDEASDDWNKAEVDKFIASWDSASVE